MRRAVFLDRDGVLLDHGGLVIPGVRRQLARLKAEGFFLAMVTNQPDIAKGLLQRERVQRVNRNLLDMLDLDDFAMCEHDDLAKCACRKPKPGMLLNLAKASELDLPRSVMVGDRWRDIGAGAEAGCTTILIGTGLGEAFPVRPMHRVADMEDAVDLILQLG